MKHFIVIVSASLLALPLFGQEKSPQLKDQKDKVSYSIGMNIGFNLARQKVDINTDILAAGIKEARDKNNCQRVGIQIYQRRNRSAAQGNRHGDGKLSRHAD